MSNNPAIHRRPSGDVDIAVPDSDPAVEGTPKQADANSRTTGRTGDGNSR